MLKIPWNPKKKKKKLGEKAQSERTLKLGTPAKLRLKGDDNPRSGGRGEPGPEEEREDPKDSKVFLPSKKMKRTGHRPAQRPCRPNNL